MWTQFWDLYSGGELKEEWDKIFIESPEYEARIIFYNRFGHNPERVSCTCCGSDYSIDGDETLERITAYHRGCKWDKETDDYDLKSAEKTVKQYIDSKNILVIFDSEIKDEERKGSVPEEGYIWM